MNVKDKSLRYIHVVEYDGKELVREEVMKPKAFAWEDEPNILRDIHTIKWYLNHNEDDTYGYYSCDYGWSKDGRLNKDNPIPELEKTFKKTIGKKLYYFDDIETPK